MSAVLTPKRCKLKSCRAKFEPKTPFHAFCSADCLGEFARQMNAKITLAQIADRAKRSERQAARKEKRAGRERLKSRRDHEREAQTAFNAYIRERDRGETCICCGRWPKTPSNHQWDAGHYRTTAAAPQLRFDEDNCHKQLVSCNRGKSGNAVEYRKRLVLKIGLARVEALENNNAVAKRDIDELKAIRKAYQVKLRDLKARREMWGAVA